MSWPCPILLGFNARWRILEKEVIAVICSRGQRKLCGLRSSQKIKLIWKILRIEVQELIKVDFHLCIREWITMVPVREAIALGLHPFRGVGFREAQFERL